MLLHLPVRKAKQSRKQLFLLAEAVGFEPTNGCPLPVFKTGAFNHSATLPLLTTANFKTGALNRSAISLIGSRSPEQ